jgi:L-gulonate 3-dehydrogenase
MAEETTELPDERPLAIIGSGSIGTSFALVFASAGHSVRIQDPDPVRRGAARDVLRDRLEELSKAGLLDQEIDSVLARVTFFAQAAEATEEARYVQECAPEDLSLKQKLFSDLDSLAPADAVIASSSSAIPVSRSAAHVVGRARFIVCHPANPPYLIRVIEVVPAAFTSPEVVEGTRALLISFGFEPIVLRKEVEGFVFNRLQGALLREAYCLVRDGVASAEEIDRLVRDGLGLRWSFMGPFETVDLNTRGGIASHALKMGPAYERMGAERGQHDPWTPDLVAKVAEERRARLPLNQWEARGAWRDKRLIALLSHRGKQPSE